jgi:Protein of unknown function (DUF2975)
MSTTTSDVSVSAIDRLRRLSTFMCAVIVVGGFLAELGLIWIWFSPAAIETLVLPGLGLKEIPVTLDVWTRTMGFAVCTMPMAVLVWLLYHAYALFDGYRLGHLFTDEAPVRLRRIGLSLLALAFLRPVTATLLGVVLTLSNPPGQRLFAVGISIDDYIIAAIGGLLLSIGHVMVEAKRLSDENRQIV